MIHKSYAYLFKVGKILIVHMQPVGAYQIVNVPFTGPSHLALMVPLGHGNDTYRL